MAKAYLDQLSRGGPLGSDQIESINESLDGAAARLEAEESDPKLAAALDGLAASLRESGAEGISARRTAGLAKTLSGIADRLRG